LIERIRVKIKSILETKVHETRPLLEIYNWENPKAYSAWLSQTYHFVKWTTRLLSLAAANAKPESENHLHRFYLKHLPEEVGHENLILNDLKAMGDCLSSIDPSTQNFVNHHRDTLNNKGSIHHLGYMLYLENLSISVGIEVLRRLKKTYKPEQMHFLSGHSEDDIDHVSSCLNFVSRLNSQEQILIMNAIEETAYGYIKIMEGLVNLSLDHQRQTA
jgi:pyrroloquinoline quinone (PQQ) biosynthesis protein C